MHATTIGLDIAKHVFQVHGVDASGAIVIRQKLRRSEVRAFFETLAPALIGMEACPTSHHWARELRALGHEVRLMPPAYVKPYVKRQKNDAADAEAICEAVSRPTMRFVPIKSVDQQSALMLHRARDLLIRQRTMLKNALRGHLAEFGLTAPQGTSGNAMLAAIVEDRISSCCTRSLGKPCCSSSISSVSFRRKSPPSMRASLRGTVPTRSVAGSRPFPALGRSSPAPWQPRSRMRMPSARGGS